MAVATKKKVKTVTQEERIADFKRENVIPFPGTLEKPYELSLKQKNGSPRPTPFDIINNLPTIEEYMKNPQSAVTIFGEHVVLGVKSTDDKLKKPLEEFCNYGFFLIVDPKTGFCCGTEEGLPFHSLSHQREQFLLESKVNNRLVKNIPQDLPKWNTDNYEWPDVSGEVPAGWFVGNQLLLNADEEVQDWRIIGEDDHFNKYACLSFSCLVNLIAKKVINGFDKFKYLTKENLKIVDFSPAQTKEPSAALKKECTKAKKKTGFNFKAWSANQKPPTLGFTLIINESGKMQWHKSATVLIRNGKESYIMGQDDGTYFGCVLADHPSNLEGAYLSLMPEEARGIKGVVRQGEWFAIPVKDQKSVPDRYSRDCLLWSDNHGDINGMTFPIEDKNSNYHCFNHGEIIVTAKGFFARNFGIYHDEHPELSGMKDVWYSFARNTALYSFSAEKVD